MSHHHKSLEKHLKSPKKKKASAKAVTKRTRRSADDILNRIVQAASEEFRRSGYAGTTTATVARKADVTEAQLFRYFGSKSNLFRETIFKPINQHLLDFTNKHHQAGATPTNKQLVQLYASELQHFISEHSEMLTSLVVAQTYDKDTAHGVGEIDSLLAYFERGAAAMSGRLKGKPKVNPKLMVRVTFASVLACIMFKDWIFPKGLASSSETEAAINTFILEGLSANSTKD
jgi:AcrR family transcriptional regulator